MPVRGGGATRTISRAVRIVSDWRIPHRTLRNGWMPRRTIAPSHYRTRCRLARNLHTAVGMRRTARVFVVIAATAAAAAAAAQHEASSTPTTVKDVMITMTIPASDAIFATASEAPKDDEQWVALRKSARMLAESGGLLMRAGLARDQTTWMERARELVNEAEATLKVAEARNADSLEAAGDKVYATCEACHARYLGPGN